MQFSLRFAQLSSLLVAASALSIPGRHADVGSRTEGLARRESWTYQNSNKHLLMGTLVENDSVSSAGCSLGSPVNCAIGSIYPVFAFFFASYQESERADDEDTISFVLPPTPAKTARERLMTELEVGIWHDVGTTTSNGQTHAVRFFHGGDYYRLRASIASNPNATIVSRSNEGRDGGFVADFYWSDNNQGAYNSFHSSSASTSFFAANAAGWMVNNAHAIAACAVFTDDDGVLDVGGVLSLGWNGQPFEFADGQLGAYYGLCTSNPQV